MTADLTNPIFHDEDAARRHFEGQRWPDGPICPHCGSVNNATEMKGKSTRPGVYKCKDCRKQFTATVGTLYERSHIPIHKWLLATRLLCASKKGMSAHQLWRQLGFGSYRTAWGSWRTVSARACARHIFQSRWAAKASSWKRTKPTSAARQRTVRMPKLCRVTKPLCRS